MNKAKGILADATQDNQPPRVKSMRSSVAFVIVFWCAVCVLMCVLCYLADAVDLTAHIIHFFGA